MEVIPAPFPDVESRAQLTGPETKKPKEIARAKLWPVDMGLAQLAENDAVPVKTVKLSAPNNVFDGLRVPVKPPQRLIDWMLKSEEGITKESILVKPVDAFVNVVTSAVCSSIRNARQMYRSRKGRDEAKKVDKRRFIHETSIKLSVKVLGRGGLIYQGLGAVIDRFGGEGKYPTQIDSFVRKLKEVWKIRIERDRELEESTSKTRYPVEARLNDKDRAVLKKYEALGYDPRLVMAAKLVDVQIRVVEEANRVFKELYQKKYGKKFSPTVFDRETKVVRRLRSDEIGGVLEDFYSLTREQIAKLLVQSEGISLSDSRYMVRYQEKLATVFDKEDYLTSFTSSLSEHGIDMINLTNDRFFDYKYRGVRYSIKYHDVKTGSLSFQQILMEMTRNKATVDANMGKTDTSQVRRDINSSFIDLQADPSILHDRNQLKAYFKARVKPGVDDKQMDRLIADVEVCQRADFYVSIDAMNRDVFGYDPANCEMDNGFGKAVQWDVSFDRGKIIVNQKNIHKIVDAGHVYKSLDHLINISFKDLDDLGKSFQVIESPFARIRQGAFPDVIEVVNRSLYDSMSKKIDFGWIGFDACVFKEASDCPRELFVEETLPFAILKGFESKKTEFKTALRETLARKAQFEKDQVDKLHHVRDGKRIWEKLQEEVQAKYQMLIEEKAKVQFNEAWVAINQSRLTAMNIDEIHELEISISERVEKEVSALLGPDILKEFTAIEMFWKVQEIDERTQQIREYLKSIKKGRPFPHAKDKILELQQEQYGKLSFFVEEIKKLIDERYLGTTEIEPAIVRQYGEMHLGEPSAMTINLVSRLLAQAQNGVTIEMSEEEQESGDMPVERFLVQLPKAERLEISTVAADRSLIAASVDVFETFNKSNLNIEEIIADWRTFVQRTEVTAGIVAEAEIYYALRNVSNTALITAGSGEMREVMMNWLTKIVNRAVNAQYHSRGMSSWINKKDPESRFSRFATALVEGTDNVEGDVSDGKNLEVIYRMTTERFLESAEKRNGVTFSKADTEQRNKIVETMQDLAKEEADRFTKMKLLTFTLMGITEAELRAFHTEWVGMSEEEQQMIAEQWQGAYAVRKWQAEQAGSEGVPAKTPNEIFAKLTATTPSNPAIIRANHKNSFLNYVVWSRIKRQTIGREKVSDETFKQMFGKMPDEEMQPMINEWSQFSDVSKHNFYNDFFTYCVAKAKGQSEMLVNLDRYDFSQMKFVY